MSAAPHGSYPGSASDHASDRRWAGLLSLRDIMKSARCKDNIMSVWERDLEVINWVIDILGTRGVAQPPKVPPLAALLKEVDPGLADVLTDNAAYVRVIRGNVINECARHLEASYPGHAWLNAACAAIRSLALPSTNRGGK